MTLASGTAAPLGSLTVPGNRATALLGYQAGRSDEEENQQTQH
jgi:hypothetical protein